MKLLLLLTLTFLLFGCVAVAESKGRPIDKGPPPGRAKHFTPTPEPCITEHLTAALGGNLSTTVTLAPGDELDLQAVYMNWSDGEQFINVSVTWLGNQEELELPAEWVTFSTTQFCVEANGFQNVAITVNVPRNADSGEYQGFFQFAACKGLICVAVAARLRLTVE